MSDKPDPITLSEPVEEALKRAYYYNERGEWRGPETSEWDRWHSVSKVVSAALAAQASHVRLTDAHIDAAWQGMGKHAAYRSDYRDFARAIERLINERMRAKVTIEDILAEFDRRAAPGVGFYELQEPAEIIRAMLAGTLAEYDQSSTKKEI